MRARDECFTLGVCPPSLKVCAAYNDCREEGHLPLKRSSEWKSALRFAIPRRGWLAVAVLSILWGNLLCLSPAGKQEKRFIPPLRVHSPFEATWEGMLRILKEEGWTVTREARAKGKIRTGPRKYISGPLTDDHMDKIGKRPRLSGAQWKQVNYDYEISIQLVSARETLITVDTNITALKRGFLGEESWVAIPSNGRLEEGLLTRFGQSLFGQTFSLTKSKKGLWGWLPEIRGGRSPSTDPTRTDSD